VSAATRAEKSGARIGNYYNSVGEQNRSENGRSYMGAILAQAAVQTGGSQPKKTGANNSVVWTTLSSARPYLKFALQCVGKEYTQFERIMITVYKSRNVFIIEI
jgi:hypothetical protein